jgi:hypothetical protein
MKTKRRRLSMDDAAYCAAAWASGEQQKSLAATFGYKKPPPISIAIREFLDAYTPVEAVREAVFESVRNSEYYRDHPVERQKALETKTVSAANFCGDERKAFVLAALLNFQRTRAARWVDGAATAG